MARMSSLTAFIRCYTGSASQWNKARQRNKRNKDEKADVSLSQFTNAMTIYLEKSRRLQNTNKKTQLELMNKFSNAPGYIQLKKTLYSHILATNNYLKNSI